MTGYAPGQLGLELVSCMEEITWDRIGDEALVNARRNLAYRERGHSLAALRNAKLGEDDSAIIVAAGPSVARRNPAAVIREKGYKGAIVATESAMYYLLRNGIVPDLVVTLDPHATRIVRWFGDPHLDEERLRADDYFSRQDMDAAFSRELEANREILALLDKYGSRIRIALSTSASKAVVDRVLETGMEIYWWNPMLDDPDRPNSRTRELHRLNGLPALNAGGNVGTAAWMMAHAVLGKRHVALTGMDFSYYAETPYRNTQYYDAAVDLVGEENLDSLYMHIHNPHLDRMFYTDPAYRWYREAFLELATDADCITYNCTEGGILFGPGITFISLTEFLASRNGE